MRRCSLHSALVIAGLSLLTGLTGRASAQAPEQCSGISGANEPANAEVHGCLKPLINTQLLINVSHAVRSVLAARLAPEREQSVETAGFAHGAIGRILPPLGGAKPIMVEPAADIPAPAEPQRLWNAWVDGKYSWIDGSAEIDDSEGPLGNIVAGVDYRVTNSVVVGLIGTFEESRLETQGLLPISQKTEGFGGGAYIGITLTPNIVLSALANYAAIETSLGESGDGETDSDRVQVSGALTGYWYSGATRFSPSLSLAWSEEWQDAYSDGLTPKQNFETALLTAGTVIGHTFPLADASTTIEPWAAAFLDYTFINDADTAGLVNVESYDDQVDLRFQLGLNFGLASNLQLALTGETSGLLRDETDTYAGQANLAVQF